MSRQISIARYATCFLLSSCLSWLAFMFSGTLVVTVISLLRVDADVHSLVELAVFVIASMLVTLTLLAAYRPSQELLLRYAVTIGFGPVFYWVLVNVFLGPDDVQSFLLGTVFFGIQSVAGTLIGASTYRTLVVARRRPE